MPNYNESSISGTAYTRCNQVVINNPKGGVPSMAFLEERFIELGADSVARPTGSIQASFRADGVFPLINPGTGEPTGDTMTHQQVYAVLYSLYISEALARDAA